MTIFNVSYFFCFFFLSLTLSLSFLPLPFIEPCAVDRIPFIDRRAGDPELTTYSRHRWTKLKSFHHNFTCKWIFGSFGRRTRSDMSFTVDVFSLMTAVTTKQSPCTVDYRALMVCRSRAIDFGP